MNLKFSYIDNTILIDDSHVNSLEIINRDYFYRVVNNLNMLSNGIMIEDILVTDKNLNEINISNKISMYIDFFNFSFDSKKIQNSLNKEIISNIDDITRVKLSKDYEKIKMHIKPVLNEMDLALDIQDDFDETDIIKILNISIKKYDTLLENLLLLIDIDKNFTDNNLIVFINLKSYLSKDEISELYKYSIYNKVKILLVDNNINDYSICNEKKLIIDEDLNEWYN